MLTIIIRDDSLVGFWFPFVSEIYNIMNAYTFSRKDFPSPTQK